MDSESAREDGNSEHLPNAVSESYPIFSNVECMPRGPRPSSITLYVKKNAEAELFSYLFVLQIRTISCQIIVPFTENDKKLGANIHLPIVPTFPNFLFSPPTREHTLFGL